MLSVVIISKNEATNIRRCLQSVRFADEIIVVDSGSADNTVECALEYTPHVFVESDWQGYGIQKQRALARASGDWVLNLDADEVVDESCAAAILLAISKDVADAYRIKLQMCFYGQLLRYSASPKRHVRLFKRLGAVYSEDVVHEKICLPTGARIAALREPVVHYCYKDLSHALDKINRYSSYSAVVRKTAKKRAGLTRALCASGWMFLRCYFIQRGFMDGKIGFLLAVLNAQESFYRSVKVLYQDINIS